MTAAWASPPARLMCCATSSTLDRVRPARKTSAPSAANSLAAAAPTEPPAPNTTACFPCRSCALISILQSSNPFHLSRGRSTNAELDMEVPLSGSCLRRRWRAEVASAPSSWLRFSAQQPCCPGPLLAYRQGRSRRARLDTHGLQKWAGGRNRAERPPVREPLSRCQETLR